MVGKKSILLSAAVLLCCVLLTIIYIGMHRNQPDAEAYLKEAIAYLEKQSMVMEEAGMEVPPPVVDESDGRVIGVSVEPWEFYRIKPFLENAVEIRRVKEVPELEYPLVKIGDRMRGNHKKMYYTASNARTIIEFTLEESDPPAFLLFLTDAGTPYPEVREAYTSAAIEWILGEINFADEDILTYSIYGTVETVDIRTRATAEKLFDCIRSCARIVDETDRMYKPEFLPIQIDGTGRGNFDKFCFVHPATGQPVRFWFTEEASEEFERYIMELGGEGKN